MDGLQILYTGNAGGTCMQRAEALRELGHRVEFVAAEVPTSFWRFQLFRVIKKLHTEVDLLGANRRVIREFHERPRPVLWVDKGLTIRPETLREVRRLQPDAVLVHYSPDDMMNPGNQTPQYLGAIPLYDVHVTTKSYNVGELRELGARDVFFVNNAYDPATHRPFDLTPDERQRFAAGVGFVGAYERDRAEQMLFLAENGVRVHIWGFGWEAFGERHENLVIRNRALPGTEYSKAIVGTRINLGFLRKVNRDLQTTRTMEIPACRAFMLAERTDEHLRLFREGEEAEFFESREELLEKCRYYLENEARRVQIAEAGYRRCLEDGYANAPTLSRVIRHLEPRLQQGSASS